MDKLGSTGNYCQKGRHIFSPVNGSAGLQEQEPVLVPGPPPRGMARPAMPGEKEELQREPEAQKQLSDRDVLERTASLWKYKPVPRDEPEPYEESITESATLGGFHVTAARVRGKKHKHEGTNCDDWFETRTIGNFAVTAVSDGAGSKKFSRIGARMSCEGAMKYLEKELRELLRKDSGIEKDLGCALKDSRFQKAASQMARIAQKAVLAARQSVIHAYQKRRGDASYGRAVRRELQLNDFAATFLLAIALPIEKIGETFVVACQVGDGMTAAISKDAPYDQIVTLLGDADSGAFSGETEFLTSPSMDSLESLMGRTRVTRKKIDVILSMTDGVADDYDPNGKEMLRLYLDLVANRVLDAPQVDLLLKKMGEAKYRELERTVPSPRSYPAPGEGTEQKTVPVQYVRDLCESRGIDLKTVWETCREQIAVMAGAIHRNKGMSEASRLRDWLDSYVVRGSFDDRTLVILQRGGN